MNLGVIWQVSALEQGGCVYVARVAGIDALMDERYGGVLLFFSWSADDFIRRYSDLGEPKAPLLTSMFPAA